MSNYCVILAGGKGKRLWPCSRENKPKQFVDIFGFGKTPLQQTYERFTKIVPLENIYITTNEEYLDQVKEQLPEISAENILTEPIQRNTAPSMAWAAFKIRDREPNANIVVTPADMLILNEEEFAKNMHEGLEFVDGTDKLLTIGVKATRPETEYGYIQTDGETPSYNIYKVKSFTEKPNIEFAEMFIKTGEFFWNTGVFISSANGILQSIDRILPVIFRNIRQEKPGLSEDEEAKFMRDHYSLYPNLSLDHGVLEKSDVVYVMTCKFGWADLGTWHNVYEVLPKDSNSNVVLDSKVILDDCEGNMIKIAPNKLAVINGLKDYIVVDDGDVLLITKKENSSALVRKYVNEVQIKYENFT